MDERYGETNDDADATSAALTPIFPNWADQVEYEEALLAEAGLRLTPTWEELQRFEEEHTITTTATSIPPYRRSGRSRGRFVPPSLFSLANTGDDDEDNLVAYLAIVRNAKYATRPVRELPPPRRAQGGAKRAGASAQERRRDKRAVYGDEREDGTQLERELEMEVVAETEEEEEHKTRAARSDRRSVQQQQQKRGTKRKNRSRAGSRSGGDDAIRAPGHDRSERAAEKRAMHGVANKMADQHSNSNEKKKHKATKNNTNEKEKLKISEVGRKLFVGGILFDDLEEDVEAQELRSEEEVALLSAIRREVFVEAVLGAFGEIERLKADWNGRYCHIVYATRDSAERAFAALSDHQERCRLCEVEAATLLRESDLPAAAAPLPSFYVRWPKASYQQCSYGTQSAPAGGIRASQHHRHSLTKPKSVEPRITEDSALLSSLTAPEGERSEHGRSACVVQHPALSVRADAVSLSLGEKHQPTSPATVVLCATLVTLYSYVISLILAH